jgi:hypothetical protein
MSKLGGCTFHNTVSGKTPEDAYDKAKEKARYMYGVDGYNGTISTTSYLGKTVIPDDVTCKNFATIMYGGKPARIGKKRCREIYHQYWDKVQKYECYWVQLAKNKFFLYGIAAC